MHSFLKVVRIRPHPFPRPDRGAGKKKFVGFRGPYRAAKPHTPPLLVHLGCNPKNKVFEKVKRL